ncbi:AraC family transcriptional regulator [Pseudonocardia sp. KRD291]|uniref:AraC family transcriptional regulator n=1 Tax=Pseudonocardia sp. KRD291 TaxID=2792007 RepID=UPI001C4A2208|nr:AraC family transcriptional regulator [Pseudonocardia sp. KRD291]MBW0107091.1 AraC family transcriptional regulator [Pseudonocardia sp. KRD291]
MDQQPPWAATDPVGEALHVLRMSGTFYCRSELTAPWGMTLPRTPGCLWFHTVTSGGCELEVTGGESVSLRPGELVLVPRGDEHRLRSAPGVATPDIRSIPHPMLDDRYVLLRHGGDGDATRMVCGAVRFEHPAARGLLDLLPGLIRVEPTAGSDRCHDTLRLIAAEVEDLRPGGEAVITRLADVLVIQALRQWLAHDPAARTGWLGALADDRMGRVLAQVHRDPSRDWTVTSLAATASMSRSAFAARFTELVGEPAMAYVTRWRMHVAADALTSGDATVAELAGRLGYRSEAAFSRAFSRTVGESPGALRRRSDRGVSRSLVASLES